MEIIDVDLSCVNSASKTQYDSGDLGLIIITMFQNKVYNTHILALFKLNRKRYFTQSIKQIWSDLPPENDENWHFEQYKGSRL